MNETSMTEHVDQTAAAVGARSLRALVEKRAAKDPISFNSWGMKNSYFPRAQSRASSPTHKAEQLALLAEVHERRLPERRFAYSMAETARRLFAEHKMDFRSFARRMIGDSQKADEAIRMMETTLGSDVATVACQILPLVTRAMANNPVLDLVGNFAMAGPSANVLYLDVKYAAAASSYQAGDRIDDHENPTYSDRTDCTAQAKKLNLTLNKETTTATDKVLGADICITAIQDAQSQYGINLEERLAMAIMQQMIREWARLVADDLRVMAGNTGSWSATVPGPYSSLNTNEWRKVLVEQMVKVDNLVVADIYEQTQWALMHPNIAQCLERVARFVANPNPVQAQPGSISLVGGEFGDLNDRWSYWKDPYFADNTILMGRKGSNLVDNEFYYFLPYIMADDVKIFFDPDDMIVTLGAITRAARKMIEPDAFGRIDITGTAALT